LTAASYNPVLKGAANAGDWQAAISALDMMAKAGANRRDAGPDVVCFNYAMAACAKAGESEVNACDHSKIEREETPSAGAVAFQHVDRFSSWMS